MDIILYSLCLCVYKKGQVYSPLAVYLEVGPIRRTLKDSFSCNLLLTRMYNQVLAKDFYGTSALSLGMHNSQYTYLYKCPFVSTLCNKNLVPIDDLTHCFFHYLYLFDNLSTTKLLFLNLQNRDFKTTQNSILWCVFQSLETITLNSLLHLRTSVLPSFISMISACWCMKWWSWWCICLQSL